MKTPIISSSPFRKSPRYLLTLLVFILFVGVVMYGEDLMCMVNQLQPAVEAAATKPIHNGGDRKTLPFAGAINNKEDDDEEMKDELEGCDVFSGKWVRDNSSRRPLYQEQDCPFLPPQVTCQEHGRPDRDYQFWRWQPHACSLPRSNISSLAPIFFIRLHRSVQPNNTDHNTIITTSKWRVGTKCTKMVAR